MSRLLKIILALIIPLEAALYFLYIQPFPVQAEPTLEAQIASATGIVRVIDGGLQSKAANRVIEIQSDFSHVGSGLVFGEAEVIGWNRGYENPLAAVVVGWLNSPIHADILLDPDYARIGCAWATDTTRTTTWLVCWFSVGPQPAPVVAPPMPPALPGKPVVIVVLPPAVNQKLPNAAMEDLCDCR